MSKLEDIVPPLELCKQIPAAGVRRISTGVDGTRRQERRRIVALGILQKFADSEIDIPRPDDGGDTGKAAGGCADAYEDCPKQGTAFSNLSLFI